jgi:hypothetical protein
VVRNFVDEQIGSPRDAEPPTLVVLAPSEREKLEDAGFTLDVRLRHAAVEVASLTASQSATVRAE